MNRFMPIFLWAMAGSAFAAEPVQLAQLQPKSARTPEDRPSTPTPSPRSAGPLHLLCEVHAYKTLLKPNSNGSIDWEALPRWGDPTETLRVTIDRAKKSLSLVLPLTGRVSGPLVTTSDAYIMTAKLPRPLDVDARSIEAVVVRVDRLQSRLDASYALSFPVTKSNVVPAASGDCEAATSRF